MSPFTDMDAFFMTEALNEARMAAERTETPIGAVIVRDGEIIARGHNLRETRQDVTLHAEMIAIRAACARLGSWRLDNCALYVTLEPCAMCAGAIQQARMACVYYGATDPKAGAVTSKLAYFDIPGLNHQVQVYGGLMAAEASAMLKSFFAWLRSQDRARGSIGIRRRQSKEQTHIPEE